MAQPLTKVRELHVELLLLGAKLAFLREENPIELLGSIKKLHIDGRTGLDLIWGYCAALDYCKQKLEEREEGRCHDG